MCRQDNYFQLAAHDFKGGMQTKINTGVFHLMCLITNNSLLINCIALLREFSRRSSKKFIVSVIKARSTASANEWYKAYNWMF